MPLADLTTIIVHDVLWVFSKLIISLLVFTDLDWRDWYWQIVQPLIITSSSESWDPPIYQQSFWITRDRMVRGNNIQWRYYHDMSTEFCNEEEHPSSHKAWRNFWKLSSIINNNKVKSIWVQLSISMIGQNDKYLSYNSFKLF